MTNLEPGSYAKWQPKHIWPKPVLGRIADVEDGIVVFVANGEAYELDPTKEKIRHVPTCAYCGGPCSRPALKFCSAECFGQSRTEDFDQWVFDTIVEYKREHDGLSPNIRYLAKRVGLDVVTTMKMLDKLVKANRIRMEGKGTHRRIRVVGGKWTYNGDSDQDLAE